MGMDLDIGLGVQEGLGRDVYLLVACVFETGEQVHAQGIFSAKLTNNRQVNRQESR